MNNLTYGCLLHLKQLLSTQNTLIQIKALSNNNNDNN
jgi:hypothetical protein